jgi:hypothetical protein
MGWYWCGIQRNFARDYMDFTELIVNDNAEGITNDFWSGEGKELVRSLLGVNPW